MKQTLINNVLQGMLAILNNAQAIRLQKVLEREFAQVEITKGDQIAAEMDNGEELMQSFRDRVI